MEHVKIVCKIDYYEPYLPPRCRKLRYEHKEEDIKVSVPSVTSQEAPVAFRLSDYHHTVRIKQRYAVSARNSISVCVCRILSQVVAKLMLCQRNFPG